MEIGEDVDWPLEVAIDMEPEDGLIWVFSLHDEDGVMAFTPYGVECLRELIREHRRPQHRGPHRMLTLLAPRKMALQAEWTPIVLLCKYVRPVEALGATALVWQFLEFS